VNLLDQCGELSHYLDIDFDPLTNAWSLDLHSHFGSVHEHSAMHLRHRSGCERLFIERTVDLQNGSAEVGFDRPFNTFDRNWFDRPL
jgi:hypothetical protein